MKTWTKLFTLVASLIMQMLACCCMEVGVTLSLLTSSKQSRQDMLLSIVSSNHTALEGKENKHTTLRDSASQNTTPSTSSHLHIDAEANANKTATNPSDQFLDYNEKNYFTDRKKFSTADHNSKRLLLEKHITSKPQTDMLMSTDILWKYRASLSQHSQQNDNVVNSLRQEPTNMTHWRSNDGDRNSQYKGISSDNGIYYIRTASTSDQQNTAQTNFHKDETRHLQQHDHLEDCEITKTENKSGRFNNDKYDKKGTLNTEMSQYNSQYTSGDKDIMKVALAESYKQLTNKENDSTLSYNVINTSNGKDLVHVPMNHSTQRPTISVSDIQDLRISNEYAEQLETNPHSHNYKQIISDQGHQISCCKHTSDKEEITYKLNRIIKLQQIITTTMKNLPTVSTEETYIQSKDKTRVMNENLLQRNIYMDTNKISNLHTAKGTAQSLKRLLTNNLGGETRSKRSLLSYPIEFSKTSDSSSRHLPKDNSYLDQGSHGESNNLAISNIWPHKVIQKLIKYSDLQQPRDEDSEEDSGMDFLKKQFQRAERLSKALEWFIRFVKVVGRVDSYLRDRIRSAVRMVARLYDSYYDRGNYRSCD